MKTLLASLCASLCAFWLVAAVPASAQDATFRLVAKAGKFEPSSIEVPAGKRVFLEVVNEGPGAIEFESKDLKQEKVIPAGKSARITLNPMKAGTYRFFDEYHEATAKGTIVAK